MLNVPNDMMSLVMMGAVFGLILSAWLMMVLLWYSKRSARTAVLDARMQTRMGAGERARILRLWREGKEATTSLALPQHRSILTRVPALFRDAGLEIPQQSIYLMTLGCGMGMFVIVASLTDSLLVAALSVVVMLLGFLAYLKMRVAKQSTLFESQLIDALELVARSLRAGHPLMGSFQLVADEMPAPSSTVFHKICQLQTLGISQEDAILSVAGEHNSDDMRLFASSVVIQIRTGGNLADMMCRLAYVVRDRIRLTRRVRVLTAQTQLSKRILLMLPFALFIVMNVMNPSYMAPMYETQQGRMLLVIGASGLALGAWVMSRLSILKY